MFTSIHVRERGALLIQLIIACAIIGILSTVAYGQYEGAKMKARDAQRVADVQTLAIALKQYRERYGTYNTGGGSNGGNEGWVSYTGGGYNSESITKKLFDAGLLNSPVMNDPKGSTYSQGYVLQLCSSGSLSDTRFAVYAKKERSTPSEVSSMLTLCEGNQAAGMGMNYGIGG